MKNYQIFIKDATFGRMKGGANYFEVMAATGQISAHTAKVFKGSPECPLPIGTDQSVESPPLK
jgi:hypothetical protein